MVGLRGGSGSGRGGWKKEGKRRLFRAVVSKRRVDKREADVPSAPESEMPQPLSISARDGDVSLTPAGTAARRRGVAAILKEL